MLVLSFLFNCFAKLFPIESFAGITYLAIFEIIPSKICRLLAITKCKPLIVICEMCSWYARPVAVLVDEVYNDIYSLFYFKKL